MNLIKLSKKPDDYCEKCGAKLYCPECDHIQDYCPECGEEVKRHELYAVTTVEKYHGADQPSNYTAYFFCNGEQLAMAYMTPEESTDGGDVAKIQLSFVRDTHRTDEYANIIADFAKWVRFDWQNPDKKSELPTLVRLIGFISSKDKPHRILGTFTALWDATQIEKEHLAWEFTQREQ
jgi:hypothetical protein